MFKSKLDNKGFAVSSVLYTLLVAFLLFLGAALAEFSTSAKLLSKANEDLTDGLAYDIKAVYYENGTSISSVSINNPSEFPYWPNKPTKTGFTFDKFLSYSTNGGASYENSASLYCKVKEEDKSGIYELPIKYGAIKNFAKNNCDGGDVEIRYTAFFTKNAKPILIGSSNITDTKVFGSSIIARNEIETIEFSNTAPSKSDGYWDASLNKDIKAYYTKNSVTGLYKIVIVGDNKILFPKNSSFLFGGYTNLKSITFGDSIDTSEVTNMNYMFYKCSSLTNLDLSKFVTSNVTDMNRMFLDCSSLTSLDLSSFETSNVTNMNRMFFGCSRLTNLDLSKFVTSNVTDMNRMFLGCSRLTSLDLSEFVTSNVTNMAQMFQECSSLTKLDLSSFKTSNVTNMLGMFEGCSSLTKLDLSSFETPNVTNMDRMFFGCAGLTDLNIKNFTFNKVTSYNSMLSYVQSSATIRVMDKTAYNFINSKRNGGCTSTNCPIGY